MRRMNVTVAAVVFALSLATMASAAVPLVIPYQGRLTNAAGTPIDGNQSILFGLFAASSGGAAVWSETQATVTVSNGLFSVDLGSVTPIPASIFTGGDLFLEIKVGADAPMTPRQRLGMVAYAARAGVMPAVANAHGTSLTATGTENLASVTATFPAAGTAVVMGSVEMSVSIPASTVNCYGISINDISATIGGNSQAFQCIQNNSASAAFAERNSSTLRVFTVAAGAKTFFLIGDEQSGSWSLFARRLVVMYFPDTVGPVSTLDPQEEPAVPAGMRRVGTTIQ